VPAYLWLIDFENLDKETHADFFIPEQVNNPKPRRIGQRSKEQLTIKRSRFPAHNREMIPHYIFALTYVWVRSILRARYTYAQAYMEM